MRTCPSCGQENPPDRDFCSCGEYLRWEPTGFVQAITPDMVQQATAEAVEASASAVDARSTLPVPVSPPPSSEPAPIPKIARTLTHGAVPPPGSPVPAEASDPAPIVLRLPDGDPAKGETLHQAVEPGQRERVLALVRNQSGIVDNYDLRVEGMPQEGWSIYPGTVYLVPFGAGGTYEQEVEVHLHPPRGPESEAREWELKVVADSKAHRVVAAWAPLALHIQPYVETT